MGPKEDKAKRGLMIRAKYLIFWLWSSRVYGGGEEEIISFGAIHCFGSSKKKGGKISLEEISRKLRFGISLCVWNFGMELKFGNTCLSWVRKTLTLQYMCILVSLS